MSQVAKKIVANTFTLFTTQVDLDFKQKLRPGGLDSLVSSLRREVDLLLQSWSLMASRNVLTTIEQMLVTAEPTQIRDLPAGSKKAAGLLKEKVQWALGKHALAKAGYDNVLLCGYKVRTVSSGFTGDADDHTDMESRAKSMLEAIRFAYNNVDAKHQSDDRMLKIFMAPEFFFRGKKGGYSSDDVLGLNGQDGLIDILHRECKKDIYKHWLFVLGTVVMLTKSVQTVCAEPGCTGKVTFEHGKGDLHSKARCSASTPGKEHATTEKATGANVDNMAIILKQDLVHTVSKELVSHIDFIASTQYHWLTGAKLGDTRDVVTVHADGVDTTLKVNRFPQASTYDAASEKPTRFTDERMGGNIFTIDGITFGCEVCLDHAATGADRNKGRLANASGIQIQLIPSGGMETCQFRTLENGVVFNVDGTDPHVQAVGRKGPDGITVYENLVRRKLEAKLASWDPDRMAELLEDGNEGDADWHKSTAKAPAPAPNGSIIEYGPFEIPKP